jgi:GT2 family glycosyltransferase
MKPSGETARETTSVIIVTRDRADVLPNCLDGLGEQTSLPDEIVLVAGDEGSCPTELVTRYKHLPISVVLCPEPNICKARNIGLEHASSDLLLFIDDDAVPHPAWIQAFRNAMSADPSAWAAAGTVLDARTQPPMPEFASGLIRPSGTQIEVHNPAQAGRKRGFLPTVKGCNFALRRDRFIDPPMFDQFFAFSFDEADLVMQIHAHGGRVIHVPDAVVDHLHSPGIYRAQGALDRDWETEFASHTMFMLKHTHGLGRVTGWCVVCRRWGKHLARLVLGVLRREQSFIEARRKVSQACAGIRKARAAYRVRSA